MWECQVPEVVNRMYSVFLMYLVFPRTVDALEKNKIIFVNYSSILRKQVFETHELEYHQEPKHAEGRKTRRLEAKIAFQHCLSWLNKKGGEQGTGVTSLSQLLIFLHTVYLPKSILQIMWGINMNNWEMLCTPHPKNGIRSIHQILASVQFSSVAQLCPAPATPWTVAHQAPLSMPFSRQGYWSRLPFPL